jgi:hypothetical protein
MRRGCAQIEDNIVNGPARYRFGQLAGWAIIVTGPVPPDAIRANAAGMAAKDSTRSTCSVAMALRAMPS